MKILFVSVYCVHVALFAVIAVLWCAVSCTICVKYFKTLDLLPSLLWHCWLSMRKSIWPVKNWVMRCWHGYLSGARCRWVVCGPADATATPSSLASLKSRMVLLFWCRLIHIVLEKRLWNGCLSVSFCCARLLLIEAYGLLLTFCMSYKCCFIGGFSYFWHRCCYSHTNIDELLYY